MLCLVLPLAGSAVADAIPVEVRKGDAGWQLYRDGVPYTIRGAGGSASLDALAAAGGNSVRTWAAQDIGPLLDRAHAVGLSVTVGIWLGHERHGFDYRDAEQVRAQYQRARETVLRYKDHPALLIWGLGNEMEGFEAGDNPAIWEAVDAIAAMVKELDPAHPTMTVTAEIGGDRVDAVHRRCPNIDIHGINSYGGAASLPQRLRAAGATKPFVLTEFGPPGTWESPRTDWGAPIEPTSTEKAGYYRRHYQAAVLDAPDQALGAYAFTWGFKMEATATWFGMFLPDGARLAAVDVMIEAWSGEPPADRAPVVGPLRIDGDARLEPGAVVEVSASVADPEGKPIRSRWALRAEADEYLTGGDYRPMLPDIEDAIVAGGVDAARVRMPDAPGPYRLFLYAYDQAGNAATANLPLLVKGERRTPMPFYVYRDGFEGMPWAPSGWMGSFDALSLDGAYRNNPHSGEACLRLRYTGEYGWVGVAWQHPPNNWGDSDGGFDLRGAKALELWARGEYGGERIDIGVGLLGEDTRYPDSAIRRVDDIVLGTDWKRYRVPLRRLDLSRIGTGFVVTVSGRSSAVTVYLDDIRFVR